MYLSSERIADAEVEAQGIQDGRHVEVGGDGPGVIRREVFVVAVGLVRGVDADAQIQADDQAIQVQTDTRTRSQGYLAG